MIECPSCRTSLPDLSKFCSTCGHAVSAVAVTDPPVPGPRPSELERRLIDALTGRYRIGKLLGQGGMGAVFLADDLELDRQVAIKVLPTTSGTDASFVERFRREARTAARLDHPHIIPIYGVESAGDLHYFVMRFVPGRSLEDVLADQPKLEVDAARRILSQAAEALGHAHRHDIVHRDVKPANIMLEGERVILTDFGISKAVQATTNLTSTGAIIGTPTYMAPEQARGLAVDGRTDQYALAVVGFEMLAGRPPFQSDDVFAVIVKHLNEPPPDLVALRPDVPPAMAAALARALAKEPGDRFATMRDFARALDLAAAADEATVLLRSSTRAAPARTRPPAPPRSRGRGLWLAAGLTGAVAVAVAAVWLGGREVRRAALGPAAEPLPTQLAAAPLPPPVLPPVVPDSGAIDRPADSASGLAPASGPAPSPAAAPPPASRPPAQPERAAPRRDPPVRQPVSDVGSPPAEQRARLTIGVDGSYATVYIDNELIGETPVVREVTFGEHEVRIEREGFKTIRQRVLVAGPTTRRFTLEPVRQP